VTVNWRNEESHWLINPALQPKLEDKKKIEAEFISRFPGHIWLATSGTSSEGDIIAKFVGLPKKALIVSAGAVNAHIKSDCSDIWAQALPEFHVGGLSIRARAHLTGAEIVPALGINEKWDAQIYCNRVKDSKATLSSLVPAQVYDLVRQGLKSPPTLRNIFVGGASINSGLYQKALSLGWKLLPTYGLTECGSQVATASSGETQHSARLEILPHIRVQVGKSGLLGFKGLSLFTGYLIIKKDKVYFEDPKKEGLFISEDCGAINDGYLIVSGRSSDFIKIGGEGVYLNRLREKLKDIMLKLNFSGDAELEARSDQRLGKTVHLYTAGDRTLEDELVDSFNKEVMPFERIREVHHVSSLNRTPLKGIMDLKKVLQ